MGAEKVTKDADVIQVKPIDSKHLVRATSYAGDKPPYALPCRQFKPRKLGEVLACYSRMALAINLLK